MSSSEFVSFVATNGDGDGSEGGFGAATSSLFPLLGFVFLGVSFTISSVLEVMCHFSTINY